MPKLEIYSAKTKTYNKKDGSGTFSKVNFKDQNGRWYDSFDRWLADVPEGTAVHGEITSREYGGKTYYSFQAVKDQPPIEMAHPSVETPQPRPDDKELSIVWQTCLKSAAMTNSGNADPQAVLDSLAIFYAEYLNKFRNQPPAPPTPVDDINLEDIPF